MALILDALATRLADVLERERGRGAPAGTPAARLYLPAKRYRPSAQGQSLREPGYPFAHWDRAYYPEWESIVDEPDPANPADGEQLRWVGFVLLLGYVTGTAAASAVFPASGTSEDRQRAAQNGRARALGDAERVRQALGESAIFRDADPSRANPALLDCVRVGATTLEALAPGQLLAATTYRVLVAYDTFVPLDPA